MLRVVAKSRRVPHEAYAVRDGFPPVAAEAMGRALSEISTATPEGRRLLAPLLRWNGFMPVDDSHYDVIREVEAEVKAAGLEFAP
jgi:ABC-type phosphate/phosphonate transport system substrate-binding protein